MNIKIILFLSFKVSNMSRTSSKFSSSTSKPRTFCKVCFDSGKPVSMHTSHNVRNDRGIVCCPTLKSIICSYCGIKGHGPKYCTRLEKDKKEQQRDNTIKEAKPFKEPVKDKPVKKSRFAALEVSSESDEDATVEVKVEPPVKKPVPQVTSKPAPWATAQPRVTKWTDLCDSSDEDEDECDD